MDPLTADLIFTVVASGVLILMCALGVAVLPWTDEEINETAEAWARLWAWLTGSEDE